MVKFLTLFLAVCVYTLAISNSYSQSSSQSKTVQFINKTLNDLRDVPHVTNVFSHVESCTYKIERLFVFNDRDDVVDLSVSFNINHVSLQPVVLHRNYKGVGLTCLNRDDCIQFSTYDFIDGNAENSSELASSSKQADYQIQSIEDQYIEDAENMGHAFETLKGVCK